MNYLRTIAVALSLNVITVTGYAQQADSFDDFRDFTGPYFGQEPPGDVPVVFAQGALRPDEGFHSAIVFSPDGKSAYWTAMVKHTYFSELIDGRWSKPRPVDFDTMYGVGEPMFSPDGNRLYFLLRRPPDGQGVVRERIWYVDREGARWSVPRLIDSVVTRHPTHWQFSFSDNGNLYFVSEIDGARGQQDIYVSPWNDSGFGEPVSLGENVNSDLRDFCPFIARDESYLIFARSVPEEDNRSDLFISFKDSDGRWLPAINMGDSVNSLHNEVCPVVTPDGKYLFFLSLSGGRNDVYWVSAAIIDRLRPRH